MNLETANPRSTIPIHGRPPLWLKHRQTDTPAPQDVFTVSAPDRNSLFCRAAWTLCSGITELSSVQAQGKTVLAVQAPDLPLLMSAWLTKLATLCGKHGVVFKCFKVLEMSNVYLKAEAEGEHCGEGRRHADRLPRVARLPVIDYAKDQWTATLVLEMEPPQSSCIQ